MAAIDPDQPVGHRTLEKHIENSVTQPRVLGLCSASFASLALMLAVVGIYGVTSYGVAQRTQEIGIRMALGADPKAVLAMVLKRTTRLAIIGVAIGAVAALALSRLIVPILFGVGAADPLTYLDTIAVLLLVALLASVGPARRASRVDPVIGMRQD